MTTSSPTASADSGELLDLLVDGRPEVGLRAFDTYGDRLFDLAVAITRDQAAAAEIVRDVVVLLTRAGPSQVSPLGSARLWLYAQVRGQVFDWLASRGRLTPEARVVEVPEVGPERTPGDLGSMVWSALAAYGERDQALVTLHLRHGLEGEVLAHAMGLSPAATEELLAQSLQRVHDGVTALLVLGDHRCGGPVVEEVRERWDGTFSPMVRRQAPALAESVDLPADVDPAALLRAIPLVPAPPSLREAVADRLSAIAAHTPGEGIAAATDVDELDDTIPPGEGPPPVVAAGPGAAVPPAPPAPGLPGPTPASPTSPSSPSPASPSAPAEGVPAADPLAVAHAAAAATAGDPPAPATDPTDPTGPVDAEDRPSAAGTPDEGTDGGPGRRRARMPAVLSIGLGAAAALLVAAIVATAVLDRPVADPDLPPPTTQPMPDLSAAGSATAGLPAPAPTSQAADEATVAPTSSAATATPTPTVAPASLVVPAERVVVPAGGASVILSNPGGVDAAWTLLGAPPWLTVTPGQATVPAGGGVEVALTRDEDLPEGDHEGQVMLSGDGVPDAAFAVVTAVDRPPVMQEVRFGSRLLTQQGCGLDSTEVALDVADESAVVRVVVLATPSGSSQVHEFVLTATAQAPERFAGVVGPFAEAGGVDVVVRATDARGNTAEAAAGQVAIAPCPGGQ